MAGFDALGWRFDVVAAEPAHDAYLHTLFRALAVPSPDGRPADGTYRVTRAAMPDGAGGADGPPQLDLWRDDELVVSARSFSAVVGSLVHDLNRRAIDVSSYLALHAGGVELDGVTVVLPGHMEAGKTTLTAGLVRAGGRYLTDEALALDWDTLTTVPYPKPLSVDAGAQALFPELDPRDGLGEAGVLDQWQVAPERIRPDAVARGGARPTLIVFPRFEAGAAPSVEPVRGGEVLVELAKNTFRFNEHGRRALDRLAVLLAGARAYRLVSGDLAGSIDAVRQLAAGASAAG